MGKGSKGKEKRGERPATSQTQGSLPISAMDAILPLFLKSAFARNQEVRKDLELKEKMAKSLSSLSSALDGDPAFLQTLMPLLRREFEAATAKSKDEAQTGFFFLTRDFTDIFLNRDKLKALPQAFWEGLDSKFWHRLQTEVGRGKADKSLARRSLAQLGRSAEKEELERMGATGAEDFETVVAFNALLLHRKEAALPPESKDELLEKLLKIAPEERREALNFFTDKLIARAGKFNEMSLDSAMGWWRLSKEKGTSFDFDLKVWVDHLPNHPETALHFMEKKVKSRREIEKIGKLQRGAPECSPEDMERLLLLDEL